MFFVPGLQKSAALFITMGTLGMLVATGMIVGVAIEYRRMDLTNAQLEREPCLEAHLKNPRLVLP